MKRIIYILLLILASLPLYGQDTIKTNIYEIVYSQALEQPLHIKYKVACPFGQADRAGMSFWQPDGIHTSDEEDYEDNVWDKGHMVPASSFSCDEKTLRQTFSYVNCALQHQSLNRGCWARLEHFEKDLAKFYEVNVEIEVIFKGPPNRLTTGAVVPTGFKKTIRFDNWLVVFYFPNEDPGGKDWHEFIIKE
jgi:DNA/RNA endonuclease G (NUC1)